MTTRLPLVLLLISLLLIVALLLHGEELRRLTGSVARLKAQVQSVQIARFNAGQVVEDPHPTSRRVAKKPIAQVNPDASIK